jgi:hypothetical protein
LSAPPKIEEGLVLMNIIQREISNIAYNAWNNGETYTITVKDKKNYLVRFKNGVEIPVEV